MFKLFIFLHSPTVANLFNTSISRLINSPKTHLHSIKQPSILDLETLVNLNLKATNAYSKVFADGFVLAWSQP
jgi:hypothetical protein